MRPSGKICSTQTGHRRQYNRRMFFACCITKATNKHSEFVILIVFPGQQLLLERTSIYLYIACLVQFVCCRTISMLVHVRRAVGTRMILVILLWCSLSLMNLSLLCEILLRLHVMRFIFWWHIDTDGMCTGKTVWNTSTDPNLTCTIYRSSLLFVSRDRGQFNCSFLIQPQMNRQSNTEP
jgi:hypothetical protein